MSAKIGEEGDFKSTDLDRTIKRLEEHCFVKIDSTGKGVIEGLRKLRNRIRHFGVTTDRFTALSLFVKTYSFAIDFVSNHIEMGDRSLPEHEMSKLRKLLGKFQPFVDERLLELAPMLRRHEPFLDCPACLQRAFLSDGSGETARCHFCGFSCEGEHAARIWVDQYGPFQSPKTEMINPLITNCPECGSESLVEAGSIMDSDDIGYVCFSCGEWGDYRACSSCGQLFKGKESICDDCFHEKAN